MQKTACVVSLFDCLTKMMHYEPIKVTIDAPGLAEVIIDLVPKSLFLKTDVSAVS